MEKISFEPGIYQISNDQYHSSIGISRSAIMEFKKSPKHYWHKYINPNYKKKEPTSAMTMGSALHCLILEEEKFTDQYAVKPDIDNLPKVPRLKDVGREEYERAKNIQEDARIKKQKEMDEFKVRSEGKTIIQEESLEKIKEIKNSVMSDIECYELITGAQYEKSIFWIDQDTGLLCKCRPDIWHNNFIVDLKTTASASERDFQRSFYEYGYPMQMAMISDGIKSRTGKSIKTFIDIAIEKEEPYASAIYPIDESALQHGLEEYKHYLFKIKKCIEENFWPGYATKTLTLPAYATIGE